jgi:hypothetical protein
MDIIRFGRVFPNKKGPIKKVKNDRDHTRGQYEKFLYFQGGKKIIG